jgi:hypothetical protein
MDDSADRPAAPTDLPPARRYADWKAPAGDGELLIWPAPAELLRDTLDNAARFRATDSVRVQNVPLPEVRRRFREYIGHADDAGPLVATGHQAELHHPGVWSKNALIDAIAAKVGGRAYHFAVDTDAPKHLMLKWPGGSAPLTDDPAAAADRWSGLLAPPTPAHLQRITEEIERAAAGWSFRPIIFQFLASLRRQSLEPVNLPMALTAALHELDWGLGLRYGAMLVSPLCQSEPYLLFVHHLLARAYAFAADYNAALAEYRRENQIRTPGRPMPDLQCAPDGCEVPFWLDDLSTGRRTRATVVRRGDGFLLRGPPGSAADDFPLDRAAEGWDAARGLLAWLRRHNLRLAPRALTLTAVLRLLVADQFVHGIGGGRYDQVLDAIIERYFGLPAPRFAVTTATLYFPEAAGQPRPCVPCVRQEGHALRHRVLGAEKMQLVGAIAAAPRRSPERRSLFHEMRRRLDVAAATHPAILEWERNVRETTAREQEERTLFDRELFYALQPAERLGELLARYRAAFGSAS